jgi:nicotinamidase-related amidase
MAAKTLLLVMDMIKDLVDESGGAASAYVPMLARRDVLGRTKQLIARAREAKALVGYVRVGFSPDYRECPANSPVFSRARDNGLFKLGTPGTEVHRELAPHAEDFDIVKHRVSPFYGTSLEPILRAQNVSRLVLCGVSTNGVVHTGAREAHDRDLECVVAEDCCAGATDDEHDSAIKCMKRFVSISESGAIDF